MRRSLSPRSNFRTAEQRFRLLPDDVPIHFSKRSSQRSPPVRSKTLQVARWLDFAASISARERKFQCAAPEWVRALASARAEEYRRFGSFSRHLRQIVLRSRSTFGFNTRGFRGSVSQSNRIVSYVVPPAKGG